jgi:hypothetical protein
MVKVWTPKAIINFLKANKYISQDSSKKCKKVVDEIVLLADKLYSVRAGRPLNISLPTNENCGA